MSGKKRSASSVDSVATETPVQSEPDSAHAYAHAHAHAPTMGMMMPPPPDRKKAKRARRDTRFRMCYVQSQLKVDTHHFPDWVAKPCTSDLFRALDLGSYLRRIPIKSATELQIQTFHEAGYIDALKRASTRDFMQSSRHTVMRCQNTQDGSDSSSMPISSELEGSAQEGNACGSHDPLENFGLTVGKSFPGCWPTSRMLAGASLCASRELRKMHRCSNAFVVNWLGGLGASATSDMSIGQSFLNDVVLAVMDLRKTFETVAVISIGSAHSNAVQEAFEYSNAVLTCSIHRYERGSAHFGSGRRKNKGKGEGRFANLNVPLKIGATDSTLLRMCNALANELHKSGWPQCMLISVSSEAISGGAGGTVKLNFTPQGIAAAVEILLSKVSVPTLLFGAPVTPGDLVLQAAVSKSDGPRHARLWALIIDRAISSKSLDNKVSATGRENSAAGNAVGSTLTLGIQERDNSKNPLDGIEDIPDDEELNPSFQRFGPHFTLRTPASLIANENTDEACEALEAMVRLRIKAFLKASKNESVD